MTEKCCWCFAELPDGISHEKGVLNVCTERCARPVKELIEEGAFPDLLGTCIKVCGKKETKEENRGLLGHPGCPKCQGLGVSFGELCKTCGGSGHEGVVEE